MNNFVFQQEVEGGWVFAKSIRNDMFLFGPTLSDVIQQASNAEAFLEHARRIGSGVIENTGRASAPHWEQLEVA